MFERLQTKDVPAQPYKVRMRKIQIVRMRSVPSRVLLQTSFEASRGQEDLLRSD